jgi:hypothetical protein
MSETGSDMTHIQPNSRALHGLPSHDRMEATASNEQAIELPTRSPTTTSSSNIALSISRLKPIGGRM